MNMPAVVTPKHTLAEIQLNHLRPYVNQRRKHFDPEALIQLAESIRAQGVAQPILVRSAKPGPDGTKTIEPYEIIAGERRWRASDLAGLTSIPAIIRDDLDDAGVEALHLIENLQRADLTLEEQCDGAAALVALRGFDKAVEESGMSKAWMSRHSRLGELDAKVQKLVRNGKVGSLEMAHDIDQLKGLDPKQFDNTVGEFENRNDWLKPPTREQLRTRVKDAKSAFDRKKKEEETKKKVREDLQARLRADPSLKAKMAAEKAKGPEAQRKERDMKIRLLKAEGEDVSRELTRQLLQLAGFDLTRPKQKGKPDELPLSVSMDNYYSHTPTPLPKSAEDANFSVDFDGGIAAIAPALNLIVPNSRVDLGDCELEEITQDEARKIEHVLGRPLRWLAQPKSLSAKKLRSLIANAKGAKQAASPAAAGKPQLNLSVSDFLGIKVIRKNGSQVKAADLHAAYSTWCEEQGRKHEILPLNGGANEFGAAIAKDKIERKRQKTGYQYLNIELKA